MSKLFKKILDIPIPYAVVIGVITFVLIVLTIQGEITFLFASGLVVLALFFMLQAYLGSIVLKTVFSSMIVVYCAAIYTSAVMSIHGNIIEPFLLTIAAVTLFLAQSYDKNKINYGLRSRPLWSSILVLLLVSFKLSFILSDYSFMIAEIIGLNILVIYIAIWRFWLNNSTKTKINSPKIVKEEVIEKFKFIHIESQLNAKESKWLNVDKKKSNAYPYIYNEVLKAYEEGLHLIFISTLNTDKFYDVEEIKINKAKSIPYMYIEDKENHYLHDAIEGFIEEIKRGRD